MRRYIISHFNEPIDIASSSLGEKNAVFGGGPNLKKGIINVTEKYRPQLIGIATTCLTETIGDDVGMIVHQLKDEVQNPALLPLLINVATPSYNGTHMEGFHATVKAVVQALAAGGPQSKTVNLLPGQVSPADIRLLKQIMAGFGLAATILPDFSDTLDGPALREYPLIPEGGTRLADIRNMGRSQATMELGATLAGKDTAGALLEESFEVPNHQLPLPIGLRATDRFFSLLEKISGQKTPDRYMQERGRLVDGFVDGHKYVARKKAVVYGEEDLVAGLTGFLAEIGVKPVLCASGGKSGNFKQAITQVTGTMMAESPEVYEGMDFYEIAERAEELQPDFLIGHSKGYSLARKLNIPLVRVGFPIHDRIGGQRILHLGYGGAQQLFDLIANTIIAEKQNSSPVGYSYM
jgi:nitrogenase molybdenum-iron protein NifN